MSNSYFQFKQFRINQDRCGMKVSTDACIQGAWTPVADNVKHVLDIGAGTGLLSMMLAQRNADILIDAIELDEAAAVQAHENVAASPWANRISVLQGDVRNYPFGKKYDLIICNPPFFQNSLKGDDINRTHARHNVTLSFKDLFNVAQSLLNTGGYCSILLPVKEYQIWEKLLQYSDTTVFNKLLIKPYAHLPANRVISLISMAAPLLCIDEPELCIYQSQNVYTVPFTSLLSPFYLHF